MDRHPAAAVARPDLAEMERILKERDADLDYACKNDRDDTGYIAPVLSCGCYITERIEWDEGDKRVFDDVIACDWHKHTAEALDDAKDITTSYDTIGPFRWSAIRKDYCGCGECRCPIGHGCTEEEALADLYEKEAA